MQTKLNIIRSMHEIIAETLNKASDEKVLTLVGDDSLKISREDAEIINEVLKKYSEINNEKDFYNAVKRDFEEIPYIIGARDESVVGQFQQMLESIIS